MKQDAPFIPNCVPNVGAAEAEAVREAVTDGWLAVGPQIAEFEQAITAYTGAAYGVALANGTAALHLALLVAGVKPGDAVPVPSLTFAATANAVIYCGASPVFLDSESESWGMDSSQLAAYLAEGCVPGDGGLTDAGTGQRIGAILPVHLYGHPADTDAIAGLARQYDIPLVEDGAEALGAIYKRRPVGSDSRLCALSFNGNKIITGGNGGMVLTSDSALADRIRYLSAQAKDDPVEFTHGEVGFNYRMANVNAAAALTQVRRLGEFVERKRVIVAAYDAAFDNIDGVAVWREASWAKSTHWMAMLTLDPARRPGAVPELRRHLRANNIEARPTWQPLHRQPAFAGYKHLDISLAEEIYRNSLCLPCSTGLSESQQQRVIAAISGFFDDDG